MNILRIHASSRLTAYVDGQLSWEESRRIEKHLEECQTCRRERQSIETAMAALEYLAAATAPDSIWAEIETKLDQSQLSRPQFSPPSRWLLAAFAAVLLVACAAYWLSYPPKTSWELTRIQGTPVLDSKPVRTVSPIRVGEWIETNLSSQATVKLSDIGSVDIAPGTKLRVIAAQPRHNRLALNRGLIHAKISAPPKLFLVDTPSGTAVDLGCEYSLRTDEAGTGLLQVTQGWVSFEWKSLESLVPAGASCRTRPKEGPAVPYFDDASTSFKEAVENFASRNFQGPVPDRILAEARVRDTLTLWHLLSRVTMPDRQRVYDRIAALAPVPDGVSREKTLKLDPQALTAWKDDLAWMW